MGGISVEDNNVLDEKMVTQHNDLIKAVAEMDRMPLKLFEIIVGSYDDRRSKDTVQIKKQLIYDLMDVKGSNKSYRLRTAIRNLHTHSTFHFEKKEDDGTITEYSIAPIQEIEWNSAKDFVQVTFAPKLLPYISMLQNNFTKYKLTDVAGLNSKHAITLYKLLAMNYNQFQYYTKHPDKLRNHDQLNVYANPKFTVKELKHVTGTEKMYKNRFSNFEKVVLKSPVKEINDNTEFSISYEKIKKGRSVQAIQFHVTKDNIKQAVDNYSKPVGLEYDYQQAVNSKYSPLLATYGVVDMLTIMQNKKLIIKLANEVYPLYDQMIDRFGEKSLNQHLTYLGTHMKADIPDDRLVKYLTTAANNRLDDLVKPSKKERKPTKKSAHKHIEEKMPAMKKWEDLSEKEKEESKASPSEVEEIRRRLATRNK